MKPVLLRLAGFTFLPLLTLVLPFLLLPIVARVVGAPGWSSITSGQAIGVFAATFILWSWNVSGPVEVARSQSQADQASIYSKSMRTRLVLAAFVLPLMTILVFFVAHTGYRLDAITMAWATALTGFSPAWFGIGTGQPRILALFDTLPRFIAAVVSAPIILSTSQIWIYGVFSLAATTVSLVAFHRKFGEQRNWFPSRPWRVIREIVPQASTAGINLTGSAYASSPVPIVTATIPSSVVASQFASADSIYRLGIFTIVAVGNTFQGWTLEHSAPDPRRRHIVAFISHVLLGLAGGLFLTFFTPWVSAVMFGESVRADRLTSFYYGLSFLFLSASTPLIRNLLVPAKRQTAVLKVTVVSAAVGISLMVTAGVAGSAQGVALGAAFSELVLFIGLLLPSGKLFAGLPRHGLPSVHASSNNFGSSVD